MDIQNVLIKNCKGPFSISLLQDFTLFLVQNSLVKMRDVEVRQNSIETFIFAETKSLTSIQNSPKQFTMLPKKTC